VADIENWLLITRLRAAQARAVGAVSPADAESTWRDAQAAVTAAGADEEADVALPVMERDPAALGTLIASWDARKTPLTAWDKAVLERALNALKRRLKLTRADDEFSSSRNPFSRGASSGITGVRPPEQYTQDIWDLLVAHGRLRDAGDGLLEIATGGARA
jgi:hypothetical protein